MIICTEERLAIGECRFGAVTDVNSDYHDGIGFLVLRESTEDEYRRWATDAGATWNPPFVRPMHFYVVSMD